MSLLSHIKEQMEIITLDRTCLGRVAFLIEPDHIAVSGYEDLVPVEWIAWVDGSVYLTKTHQQIMSSWGYVEPALLVQPERVPLSAAAGVHLPMQR